VVDAYLGAHHDRALEFDSEGNPVGETAELVAEMENVELAETSGPPSPSVPAARDREERS
jgi:branched-chain amino acid transport system ATP-binding protein